MLLLIWADEKYNTQKIPVFSVTQKNPYIFHKPFQPKFLTQKQNPSDPRPLPPSKSALSD